MSLPRYVSLLKNVRTLVYVDPEADLPKKELEWVRKKHRYRSVGVAKTLLDSLPEDWQEDYFSKKPFVELSAPLPEVGELPVRLREFSSELPLHAFQSLILASSYVAPVLVLGTASFRRLEPVATWTMTSTAELPDIEIRRNLRIVGYAILDFHEEMTSSAYEALKDSAVNVLAGRNVERSLKKLDKLLEKRKKKCERDGEHRFWRLRQRGEVAERAVVAYLDLVPLMAEAIKTPEKPGARAVVELLAKATKDFTVALAPVVGFIFQLA